jgi:hypothetical protein
MDAAKMMDYSQYVGKYVCYGNSDGGFCWGKIKSAVQINSQKGFKDAFVLTDRITCPGLPYKNMRRHSGDTLLQIDKISLEQDIVEKDEPFKDLTDDELFLLVMRGEVNLARLGNKGLGIKNLLESTSWDAGVVKQALADRLENN